MRGVKGAGIGRFIWIGCELVIRGLTVNPNAVDFATDGLMILPLSLAAYFAVRAEDRQRGTLYLWACLFCGVAFWFKPSAAWVALGSTLLRAGSTISKMLLVPCDS